MKIEIGQIKSRDSFVTLPKFMIAIHKLKWIDSWFFKLGRLYVGYVGLMLNIPGYEISIWIHNMQKDYK